MANIQDSLANLMTIDGCVAAALVDANSGLVLGKVGSGIDLDLAGAGNTEVVRAKMKTMKSLGLKGNEVVSIEGLAGDLKPLSLVPCHIRYADGSEKTIQIKCRIDTAIEIEYVENGGVLHYVLRNLAAA